MNRLGRFFFNVSKGIYDIFATYLLVIVIYVTIVSLGLHLGFYLIAEHLEFESLELMWITLSRRVGIDALWLRLVIFGGLQVVIFGLLKGPLHIILRGLERGFSFVERAHSKVKAKLPRLGRALGVSFSLVVTLMLIPFVIQPTLVPMKLGIHATAQRLANLADGEATLALADSVVGFYRKIWAKPRPIEGLPAHKVDDAILVAEDEGDDTIYPVQAGNQPMMDRWDPYIWKAAGGDKSQFAFIKAFMWVESAGRQFAVSRTGCMGLMQFCSGTAKSDPYDKVFGTGQVYRCACNGPCKVSRSVQADMERGEVDLIEKHKETFPCEVTDARFDGVKAIRAGGLYISRLRASYGDNIYLMYIGYNSGPAVANKVFSAIGRETSADLATIELHLSTSLEPWYGESARGRARGLVKTHLPKIKRAYDRYLDHAKGRENVACLERAEPAPMMPVDMPPELAAWIDALEHEKMM